MARGGKSCEVSPARASRSAWPRVLTGVMLPSTTPRRHPSKLMFRTSLSGSTASAPSGAITVGNSDGVFIRKSSD